MLPVARRLSAAELEQFARACDVDSSMPALEAFDVLESYGPRLLAELAELRGRFDGYLPPAHWRVIDAPTHADWLRARQDYLTASDYGAVVGMSPYKTRAAVVKAKAFPQPESAGSRAMQLGQFLEDGVAKAFGHFTGRKVVRVRNAAGSSVLVAHPTIPGLAASLDAVELGDDGTPIAAVEIKVTGDVRGYNYTPARVQLQVQMACVGLDTGHVVVNAGSRIDWRTDEKVRAQFRADMPGVVAKFWEDVAKLRAKGA